MLTQAFQNQSGSAFQQQIQRIHTLKKIQLYSEKGKFIVRQTWISTEKKEKKKGKRAHVWSSMCNQSRVYWAYCLSCARDLQLEKAQKQKKKIQNLNLKYIIQESPPSSAYNKSHHCKVMSFLSFSTWI